jgi:hypothetical protein
MANCGLGMLNETNSIVEHYFLNSTVRAKNH